MRRRLAQRIGLVVGLTLSTFAVHVDSAATAGELTMDDAVRSTLARNRDIIAAKLQIDVAATDVIAARMRPNPVASYSVGNLVLGRGNDQDKMLRPGFFDQPVQSVGVSQVLDLWSKRQTRADAAQLGVEVQQWLAADAIRTIVHAVRSAFIEVLREQAERALAREVAQRYAATTKLSRARFAAGDISEAEVRKVELEGIRYENAVIDADSQWDLARTQLAVLMGLPDASTIPDVLVDDAVLPPSVESRLADTKSDAAPNLVALALSRRPDLHAAQSERTRAASQLTATRREVYPDVSIAPTYTHSGFTASGDNPNVLGIGLSLPLPVFDRNQANAARARVDIQRSENEQARIDLVIHQEVADATRRDRRARQLVAIFEGGMLNRVEDALKTSERLYHAGASSLLDFLEAQRTYLETRGQYLRARHDLRQASVDVAYVVAEGDGNR